jgi:RNA polymerase sigma factor (sigma-70 family)
VRNSRAPSFSDVYDDQVWSVYGFLAYRLGSQSDAEDLTQVTFERALRAWPRFDPRRSQPSTWLLAIARNVLIDHWRSSSHRRHDPMPEELDSRQVDGPESRLDGDPRLAQALATLSDRDRELIGLRFGADLSGPQIAELTGETLATVQQGLSRAQRRLRQMLSEPAPR